MEIIGIIILIVAISVVSSFVTARIIVSHCMEILADYADKCADMDKRFMDDCLEMFKEKLFRVEEQRMCDADYAG